MLVTGAASGLGRAVAECFLAEGWDVVGVDLDATGPAGEARYRAVPVDITALSAALDPLPSGLRAVVNAAGIAVLRPVPAEVARWAGLPVADLDSAQA